MFSEHPEKPGGTTMKKRALLLLLTLALLITCAVFTVSASGDTVPSLSNTTPTPFNGLTDVCPHCKAKDPSITTPVTNWVEFNNQAFVAGTHYVVSDDLDLAEFPRVSGDNTYYYQNCTTEAVVWIKDNVTVTAADGSNAIRAGSNGNLWLLGGDNAKISGSGVTGTTATNGGLMRILSGGKVYIDGDLTIGLSGSVSSNNMGGLVDINNGTLYLRDGTLNAVTNDGTGTVYGAVVISGKNGNFEMSGGIVNGNTAKLAPIYLSAAGNLKISGGTVNGSSNVTNGGAIYVNKGTLTINGGTINGGSVTNGGAIYQADGTVNINSGTISGGVASDKGGAIYVNGGTLNIGCDATNYPDGPTISGAQASSGGGLYISATGSVKMEAGSISGCGASSVGGAVYVAGDTNGNRGLFDMAGGTVTVDGTKSGNSKGIRVQRGSLKLSGTASVFSGGSESGCGVDLLFGLMTLDGTAQVSTPEGKNVCDILVRANSGAKLTVEKTWEGSATVLFKHIVADGSYAPGGAISTDWAVSTGDYSGALYLQSEDSLPRIYGKDGKLVFSDVQLCTDGANTWFKNNAEAVTAYAKSSNAKKYIKLYNNSELNLNGNEVYVDFNGNQVAVTVGNGGMLYGFDSSAVGTVAGTAQVQLTGDVETFTANPITGEDYVAFTENDVTTFHLIRPVITGVSLRPSCAGLYYTGKVNCDSALAEYVTSYGVALSTDAMPALGFAKSLYTAEEKALDPNGKFNGVLVTDILNGGSADAENALKKIYANAYVTVKIGDQEKTFLSSNSGNAADLSIQKVLRKVNNGAWRKLSEAQKNGVKELYEKYKELMSGEGWKLYNIQAYANGDTHVKSDLKILMIGNSLSVDAGHMLAHIAKTEGAESIHIGTLYYSGCTLSQHVDFLTHDQAVYRYYDSGFDNPDSATYDKGSLIPKTTEKYTMKMGIEKDAWDIIVMQQGVFEAGNAESYNEDMQTIMDYVRAYCRNPDAVFVWNSIWAGPVDPVMVGKATNGKGPESSTYESNYKKNVGYATDKGLDENAQNIFFAKIIDAVTSKVETNSNYVYWIPSGTAMQNALSSELGDQDLYRDYIHASDLGRYIYSYMWYCALTGMEFTGVKEDEIPYEIRYIKKDDQSEVDPPPEGEGYALTDELKRIITWSIQKAFENPYGCTPYEDQSQS